MLQIKPLEIPPRKSYLSTNVPNNPFLFPSIFSITIHRCTILAVLFSIMRVQVYSRWSINRLNREGEREREGWSRRGVKGQRGLFLPEQGKERVERRGVVSRPGTRANTQVRGLEGSERGCSDVRMTQCCNLPTSSSRILLALRLTLTLAEHRSVSSNEVSGERRARGSPVCLPFQAGLEIDRRSSE